MSDDTTIVPADHEVTVFHMSIEPGVRVTDGNAIIANLGLASDDGDRELDEVLAAVDQALAARSSATFVEAKGPLLLSSLFAPNTPPTKTVRSPITWVLHDGNVVAIMASERRRAALLTFMHRQAREGVPQAVFFIDPPEPSVAIFAQLMVGFDIVMRQPDANDGQLLILVEVKRPDATYTALAGAPIPIDGLPSASAPGSLITLAPQVITMRAEKLEITDRPVAFRAPRLRDRILAEPDPAALLEELLARDLPFFALRKPDQEDLDLMTLGDVRALPIYADVICMHWAAADLKLGREAYVPEPADMRPVLRLAAADGLGIAIGTYRDREHPIYALLPPDLVANAARRV